MSLITAFVVLSSDSWNMWKSVLRSCSILVASLKLAESLVFKTAPFGMALTFAIFTPAFSRWLCIEVQLVPAGGALSSFFSPSMTTVTEFVEGFVDSASKRLLVVVVAGQVGRGGCLPHFGFCDGFPEVGEVVVVEVNGIGAIWHSIGVTSGVGTDIRDCGVTVVGVVAVVEVVLSSGPGGDHFA